MKTFKRAALLALVVSGLMTASAGAATVPPGLLVVNGTASTLTSYPLSAHDDARPAATVAADSTPSLHTPEGVALDAAGDAWVANVGANTVVEYSQAQLAAGGTPTPITTITATNGSLALPTGLTFDSAGDLWVTNSGTSTLVKYTPGQIAAGGAQTPAVTLTSDGSNSLDTPYYLAFDAAGNLWVPNFMANTLVEFTPDQLAASGDPTPAATISPGSGHELSDPSSIAFDPAGDLWTAAFGSNRILEYTPSQLSTGTPTPAKTLAATSPSAAQFDSAGDLWATEYFANSVVEFDPAQVGAGGSSTPVDTITGNDTGLNGPVNIVVEQAPAVSSVSVNGGPVGTPVPISGTGFYRGSTVKFGDTVASVKYVSPYQLTATAPSGTGTVDVTVTTAFGSSATSPGDRFTYSDAPSVPPTLLAANDGTGMVTSFPLTASGNVAPAATVSDAGASTQDYPVDGALDAAGDAWLPGYFSGSVVEYTRRQLIGGGPQTPAVRITNATGSGGSSLPSGAAFDSAGDLWVTDASLNTVVEYTKAGLATGGALVPAISLASDSAGSLNDPDGLDFDASGNLWVANFGANTVVGYSKAQLASGGAVVPAVTLSADSANSLDTPDALTFDRHGDLWVTNGADGNSVVEYTPGQLVTGAPSPAVMISSDAAGSLNGSDQAQFDAAGDLWVANFDPMGNAGSIVEFTPAQLASSGSPTPVDTIGGDATGLSNPWVLLLEQAPTVSGVSPAGGAAAGGTPVTITGTGFYPGSTVAFGGTAAGSVKYVSPYELTAVSPAGSGTVDVTVSTGQGTSAVSAGDQFAYAASPVASPPPPAPAASTTMRVPRIGSPARQLKVTGHVVPVTLACSVAACQGTVRLTERTVVTVRQGKRTVRRQKTIVLGTVRYAIKAGHRAIVNLRLSAAALAALAHAKAHRLNAELTVTVRGGQPLIRQVVLVMVVKPGHARP